MSSICPCCELEISIPPIEEGDMGDLFNCEYCDSVLKIEADGELTVIQEQKPEESHSPETKNIMEVISDEEESLEEKEFVSESPAELKEEQPEEEFVSESPAELKEEQPEEEFVSESPAELKEEQPEEELESEPVAEEPESSESFFKEDPLAEAEVDQSFSDVAEHGNSPVSSEKGFLRYDLQVSGLDSVELEQAVLDILEDSRFQFNVPELLRTQNNGVLEIKNLNPIKAWCLVQELSNLPLELNWKQYMAVQLPPEEEEISEEETEEEY